MHNEDKSATSEDLLEPPRTCSVCQSVVTRWNSQYLCKQCGASWILIRNNRAENLAMLWFFGAVGLLMFVPIAIGIAHLAVAIVGCGFLAARLKREHRYQPFTRPGTLGLRTIHNNQHRTQCAQDWPPPMGPNKEERMVAAYEHFFAGGLVDQGSHIPAG